MTMFGDALAAARTAAKVSRAQLAARASSRAGLTIDPSYLSRLERGQRHPSPETVDLLARALGLDRYQDAVLYRAAGYWPPSIVGAARVAEQEMGVMLSRLPVESVRILEEVATRLENQYLTMLAKGQDEQRS